MKAAQFHHFGDPGVLQMEDIPEPHAGPGAVRVKVLAVSVNPIDYLLRSGQLSDALPLDLPAVPGRDAVGVVDEVGPGVTGAGIGDVVFGLGGLSDTTAEYAVLTAWATVPEAWSVQQAAAAGLASATAANVIASIGDVDGRTVLIEGASGAVGYATAAVALASGATVIGTGRQENHGYLADLGVIPTTYGPGLEERVADLAPGGIGAAVHAAPSPSLPDLLGIVGDTDRVVTVIDAEGAERLGVRKIDAENNSALLERAAELGRKGLYIPRADHGFPLAEIARAHEVAESSSGKVVVTVG